MTKTIHLHIGLAKTGTTAIQKLLTVNRDALSADGVCYPKTGVPHPRPSHSEWALECQKAPDAPYDDLTVLRDEYEKETEAFERIIVSSEGFQNVTDFTRLRYLFRHGSINVVCFLREYLDLVRSTYAQHVQMTQSIEDFRSFCARHAHFDLAAFLRNWRGFGDLTALRYVNPVASVFLDAVGVETEPDSTASDPNPSIAGNLLAFKLQLNQHVPHEPLFYNGCLRLALQEPRWRGGFRIEKREADRLRADATAFNKAIDACCGEAPMRYFEDGKPLVDPEMWDEDVERILSDRVFASVRDNPEIRRLPDIGQWFGR